MEPGTKTSSVARASHSATLATQSVMLQIPVANKAAIKPLVGLCWCIVPHTLKVLEQSFQLSVGSLLFKENPQSLLQGHTED